MTSTTTQNQIPNDLGMADLLELHRKATFASLNCHSIGTVQSFNPGAQTATATINYKRTQQQLDSVTGQYVPVLQDYPLLLDCPCIVLGGGGAALTFPVAKGDECVVLFNDRDIDNWFSGGTGSAPATPRMHSTSDGLILVGVRSLANVIAGYDSTRAVLRKGTAMVGVGAGGTLVKIANTTVNLGTVLQSLLTNLENLTAALAVLTVTCASAGNPSSIPVNAPAILAIGTNLVTIAAQLGGLIE